MLNLKTIAAFKEHGDTWCLDVNGLSRFVADGERKSQPRLPKVTGSLAVIPISGVITKRGSWFSDGLDRITRTATVALASKTIGGIVFDIDSPGGSSYGLQEFADWLFKSRGQKPMISVANPQCCSAALWAGSSADQLIASPSADVGSVGVWSLHMDCSKMLELDGVKPTFIFAGKYKVEGNPYEPLTDAARDAIQLSVDETYSDFVASLARNRGVTKSKVMSDFGEGRVLSAERARAAGMIDRIASLSEVLISMCGSDGAAADSDYYQPDCIPECKAAESAMLAAWTGEIVPILNADGDVPDPATEMKTEPAEPTGVHGDLLRRKRERERTRA